MEYIDIIKKRRSIRRYKKDKIPKEIIEKIVDAARFAPTARAVEPWEFIVITESSTLKKIAEYAEYGKFIAQATACIAVFCKETKYYLEDGCAAVENILIAATSLGIGTCWVAGDKKVYCPQISNLLKVPSNYKLIALISMGYPLSDTEFRLTNRRPLDHIIHWEQF